VRGLHHRGKALDALGDGAVDVLLAEGSLAAPKTQISSGRSSSAASRPFVFGVSTE
jgi:hypothetical protein